MAEKSLLEKYQDFREDRRQKHNQRVAKHLRDIKVKQEEEKTRINKLSVDRYLADAEARERAELKRLRQTEKTLKRAKRERALKPVKVVGGAVIKTSARTISAVRDANRKPRTSSKTKPKSRGNLLRPQNVWGNTKSKKSKPRSKGVRNVWSGKRVR